MKRKEYNEVSKRKYSMWREVAPLRSEVGVLKAQAERDKVLIELLQEKMRNAEEKAKNSEEKCKRVEDVLRLLHSIVGMIQNPSECIKSASRMALNILKSRDDKLASVVA